MLKQLKAYKGFRKQQGLTLVEIGLALAISATIIVVLLVTLRSTNDSKNVTQASKNVSAILSAAIGYGPGADDENINVPEAALESPFDGSAITVESTGDNATNLVITVGGANVKTCADMQNKWEGRSGLEVAVACTAGVFTFTNVL